MRRLNFLSRSSLEDGASEVSVSESGTVTSESLSATSSLKRFLGNIPIDLWAGDSVDDRLKSLYPDMDSLELRCRLSVRSDDCAKMLDDGSPNVLSDSHGNALPPSPSVMILKTPESVLNKLPNVYFTPDFDPIRSILESLSSSDDIDVVESFMEKIEEADTDKDFVLSKLSTMIEQNQESLVSIMRDAGSINSDLSRASVQLTIGRRKLRSARMVIEQGELKIVRLQAKKERLMLIKDCLSSLKAMRELCEAELGCIDEGALGRAAELALGILSHLRTTAYNQYDCLVHIRRTVEASLIAIRQRGNTALRKLCHQHFSPVDYSNILKAYVILDHIQASIGVSIVDMSPGEDMTPGGQLNCFGSLVGRIQKYLSEAVESSLRTAAVEMITAAQQKKKKQLTSSSFVPASASMTDGDKNNHNNNNNNNNNNNGNTTERDDASVALAELRTSQLYARLSPDIVVPVIIRACELLTEVLHTHFLLTQWHRRPFDRRNEEQQREEECSSSATSVGFLYRGFDDDNNDVATDSSSVVDVFNTKAVAAAGSSTEEIKSVCDLIDSPRHRILALFPPENFEMVTDGNVGEAASVHVGSATAAPAAAATAVCDTSIITEAVREGNACVDSKQQQQQQQQQGERERLISAAVAKALSSSPLSPSPAVSLPLHMTIPLSAPALQNSRDHEYGNAESTVSNAQFKAILIKLNESKEAIWEQVTSGLCKLLQSVSLSSSVAVEDLSALSWSLEAVLALGQAYRISANDTPASAATASASSLLSSISAFCFGHFVRLHYESFQVLRQMVDVEAWAHISINMSEVGGVVGLAKSSLLSRLESAPPSPWGVSDLTGPALGLSFFTNIDDGTVQPMGRGEVSGILNGGSSAHSLWAVFGRYGNPLHFMSSSKGTGAGTLECDDVKDNGNGEGKQESQRGEKKDRDETDLHSSSTSTAKCGTKSPGSNVWIWGPTLDLLDDPESNCFGGGGGGVGGAGVAGLSGVLVTQTALNGLVRYAARYVHLMRVFPHTAVDILGGMCQLFDFYLCAVFVGFVGADERIRLLGKTNKMTAPPPAQYKELENLVSYMDRALSLGAPSETDFSPPHSFYGHVKATPPPPPLPAHQYHQSASSVADPSADPVSHSIDPHSASTTASHPSSHTAPVSAIDASPASSLTAAATTHANINASTSQAAANANPGGGSIAASLGLTSATSLFTAAVAASASTAQKQKIASLLAEPGAVDCNDPSSFYSLHAHIVAAESTSFASKVEP